MNLSNNSRLKLLSPAFLPKTVVICIPTPALHGPDLFLCTTTIKLKSCDHFCQNALILKPHTWLDLFLNEITPSPISLSALFLEVTLEVFDIFCPISVPLTKDTPFNTGEIKDNLVAFAYFHRHVHMEWTKVHLWNHFYICFTFEMNNRVN